MTLECDDGSGRIKWNNAIALHLERPVRRFYHRHNKANSAPGVFYSFSLAYAVEMVLKVNCYIVGLEMDLVDILRIAQENGASFI
jgi:hypothetical protein